MPARTYSTDVNLSCPCADCEGRKVRITSAKFRKSLTTPGGRGEPSGGLSGTAMGRLDPRWKLAADDVQMVAEGWGSP